MGSKLGIMIHEQLHDGVSLRDPHGHGSVEQLRYKAQLLTRHVYFEYVIGALIAVNAIIIGYETELSLSHESSDSRELLSAVEDAFLAIYTMELALRIFALGWRSVHDRWMQFDAVVVWFGLAGKLLSATMGVNEVVSNIMLIRMFRLMRLIRALRMIKLFKQMWSLVYGLLTSAGTMFSTLGLLVLCLFIFACMGVDLISMDEDLATHDDTKHIVTFNFGSLILTMLTLVQFVTMDSIAAIYMPLIVRKPSLAIYFVLALLFISIALMNLVTATLVEGALQNAARQRLSEDLAAKEKMKKIMPTILEVFNQIDDDASGQITIDEMEKVQIDLLPKEFVDKVSVDSMKDLFEILDVDGHGLLTQEEFVDGLMHIALLEVSLPTIQTLKLVKSTFNKVKRLDEQLASVSQLLRESPQQS